MSLPDYIERRADILAEMFVRDLNPKFIFQANLQRAVWDYMAAFQTKKGRLVNITITVKATEKPIPGTIIFVMSSGRANQIVNSNLPVLLLLVDVKTSAVAWNWISEATVTSASRLRADVLVRVPAIKQSAETVRQLRAEIEAM